MIGVLKVEEAALLLDCEIETVNARAASGELPGLKVGRSWIFPVRALEARLNELAVEEAAQRRQPRPRVSEAAALPARRSRRAAAPSLA